MTTKLKSVDVVLVGFGWTASILGQELTDAGLEVVAIERGKFRDTVPDFATTHIRTSSSTRCATDYSRNRRGRSPSYSLDQSAFADAPPRLVRPGSGWVARAFTGMARTGASCPPTSRSAAIPSSATVRNSFPRHDYQDWGVSYEDLEPYYDKWEYLCGVSGQAGNVQGKIQPGGNPFEGTRVRDHPLPPLKRSAATAKFDQAAKDVGFKPFPCAAANTSQPYKNPYGVQMGQCTYCGYCEWFTAAITQSLTANDDPSGAAQEEQFSYRTNCDVTASI
jgi:gluconate 2-dehydrogenase alpha chain